jgi:hypothetical protein
VPLIKKSLPGGYGGGIGLVVPDKLKKLYTLVMIVSDFSVNTIRGFLNFA